MTDINKAAAEIDEAYKAGHLTSFTRSIVAASLFGDKEELAAEARATNKYETLRTKHYELEAEFSHMLVTLRQEREYGTALSTQIRERDEENKRLTEEIALLKNATRV